MKSKLIWAFVLLAVLTPTACARAAPWRLHNVTGHLPDLAFSLRNDEGRAVTADDYKGKIVLLYFGFAGCSTQCPLTLARLSSLLRDMAKAADGMQVLFVTVDPAHDTPEALRAYLKSFDARHMRGLDGKEAVIGTLTKRYRSAWRPGAGGQIAHGDTVYIFDRAGRARLLLTPADPDCAAATDLKRLAAS